MAQAEGSIRSNHGAKAQDRKDAALDGAKAVQRQHLIDEALAASVGQAGLDQGDAAKQALTQDVQE